MRGRHDAETWLVEFRPEGDGPPMAIRVRAMLKRALRQWGLRAVVVREVPADAKPSDADGSGGAAGMNRPQMEG